VSAAIRQQFFTYGLGWTMLKVRYLHRRPGTVHRHGTQAKQALKRAV
jgi:hypothetical protein